MFCRNCGKENAGSPDICSWCRARSTSGGYYCQSCGAETNTPSDMCTQCGAHLVTTSTATSFSTKSRLVTTLLASFLGAIGAHRFYLGKPGTAIAMLGLFIIGVALAGVGVGFIFLVPLSIWNFIDFIRAAVGNMRDRDGAVVKEW